MISYNEYQKLDRINFSSRRSILMMMISYRILIQILETINLNIKLLTEMVSYKIILPLVIFLVAFTDVNCDHFQSHIESGITWMPDGWPSNGFMLSGKGERHTSVWVKFKKCFQNTPTITLGLIQEDAPTSGLSVIQESIMPCDFIITFKTWGDHIIATAGVNWLALGLRAD